MVPSDRFAVWFDIPTPSGMDVPRVLELPSLPPHATNLLAVGGGGGGGGGGGCYGSPMNTGRRLLWYFRPYGQRTATGPGWEATSEFIASRKRTRRVTTDKTP